MRRFFCLIFLLAAGVGEVTAQTLWQVDRSKSSVEFKIRHMVIRHVTGRFHEFTAKAIAPEKGFANAQVEAIIQVKSVDTGRESRDNHLRQEDFFYAEKYPEMIFKSISVTATGNDNYKMTGNLTIREVTRPIELAVKQAQPSTNGSAPRARFTATGALNRFDYGLKYDEQDFVGVLQKVVPLVGDSVQIMLDIELVREDNPTNGSAKSGVLHHLQAFLATLDEQTRAKTVFPFEVAERKTWNRSPGRRPGLRVDEMSAQQKEIVNDLLKGVLSTTGYENAKAIMVDQDVLAEQEEGLGAGYYWLAIYGEPGSAEPWGWRFGGHHLSLHFTYARNELISCTPAFFGAEQTLTPGDPRETAFNLLIKRRDLARSFVNSLNQKQAAKAQIASTASHELVISETKTPIRDNPTGLPISELTEKQRAIFFKLIAEYTDVFQPALARSGLEKIKRAKPENIYFSWAGNRDNERAEHYYRIQGPGFLLEYWNSGYHTHTIWREVNDYGVQASTGGSL